MTDAADAEERNYPNLLLTGPPGVGKTSLGKITYGALPYQFIDGSLVNSTYENLRRGFYLIDEIHNVKPEVCDSLNLVIDTGAVTIIGCTTNPGKLPGPFRSRFQTISLTPYTVDDLVQIMRNVLLRKQTLELSDDLLQVIAERGRGTPRVTLKYLSFVMDLMVVKGLKSLDSETLEQAWSMLGVDSRGLLGIDYKYLEAFPPTGQPVGIQYLAAVLSEDKETIEQEIEPYLMQLKLIDRTPRGRVRVIEDETKSLVEMMFANV